MSDTANIKKTTVTVFYRYEDLSKLFPAKKIARRVALFLSSIGISGDFDVWIERKHFKMSKYRRATVHTTPESSDLKNNPMTVIMTARFFNDSLIAYFNISPFYGSRSKKKEILKRLREGFNILNSFRRRHITGQTAAVPFFYESLEVIELKRKINALILKIEKQNIRAITAKSKLDELYEEKRILELQLEKPSQ